MKIRPIHAVLLCTLALGGCAPWVKVEQTSVTAPDNSYQAELPLGWVRFALAQDKVIITRDGLGIQYIEIGKTSYDKALPKTKKRPDADMLPTELSELVLAEAKSDPLLANLVVTENAPAKLSGRPGFRLRFTFKNKSGVAYERVIYGAAFPNGLVTASYQALSKYYWEREYKAFERVVGSLKVNA